MQQAGGRCNRIRGKQQVDIGQLTSGDQAPGQAGGAVNVAVQTGLCLGLGYLVNFDAAGQFSGFTVGMAGIEGGYVGVGDVLVPGKLFLQVFNSGLLVALEQPEDQAQGPHILAAQGILVTQVVGFNGGDYLTGNIHFKHAVSVKRAIFQRVGFVFCLVQILVIERT